MGKGLKDSQIFRHSDYLNIQEKKILNCHRIPNLTATQSSRQRLWSKLSPSSSALARMAGMACS